MLIKECLPGKWHGTWKQFNSIICSQLVNIENREQKIDGQLEQKLNMRKEREGKGTEREGKAERETGARHTL